MGVKWKGPHIRSETFVAPFGSNWHRRPVAIRAGQLLQMVTADEPKRIAAPQPPPFFFFFFFFNIKHHRRVKTPILETSSERGREWRGAQRRGADGSRSDKLLGAELRGCCGASSGMCAPLSSLSPALSLPRADRGGRSQSAHILHLASITRSPQTQS